MRIASFVPAATELIASLGLRQQLVGVTHACGGLVGLQGVEARLLTRCRVPTGGSGSAVNAAIGQARENHGEVVSTELPELEASRPELVILPAERPGRRAPCFVDTVRLRHAAAGLQPTPQLMEFGPSNLTEVYGSTRAIGEAVGKGAEAARLVAELKGRVEHVRATTQRALSRPRVALLSWLSPPIGAGGLLAELVTLAGGRPVLGDSSQPAFALDWAHVVGVQPEVILVAPCDFGLERARAEADRLRGVAGLAQTPAARWGQVHAVDARRWFSAPGPLSVRALEILAALVHPELPWAEGLLPREAWGPVALEE